MYETWLGVLKRETANRPDAARRYGRDMAGLDNALTFVRGMRSGFEEADFLERLVQPWCNRAGTFPVRGSEEDVRIESLRVGGQLASPADLGP